jgi:hypothetical protein
MVRRTYAQRTLVEVLLPDADKLWDPVLRQIDRLLEDDDLVDAVTGTLARRRPLSVRRGRLGTPAAVVLRMLVLKHLYDWSFDECEREVRGSLVYRAFCRIDGERVPDAKTLIRLTHVLDGPILKQLLERLVELGHERRDPRPAPAGRHHSGRDQYPLPDGQRPAGRRGPDPDPHDEARRGPRGLGMAPGTRSHAERGPARLRDRPGDPDRDTPDRSRGAGGQPGTDASTLS